ncbi:universal stress protein [Natrialbaceae archaeon AArc-T1-2]|uniref:universal stress protein n=1 Tax=Natrialbaceae archaeon AArc-T1-2 TaxID=3053904 RepID=UPI00255AE443|nr:universal stress protein [Natrialbaceae archaeon AArc-T1-2]WIV68246.1 universal stress protein [Natrialbaceae archaeon AArc-T1-2]
MYARILAPTDGSDVSVVAAETAFSLARRFDSVVHAVHVLEDGDSARGDRLVAAVEEVAPTLMCERRRPFLTAQRTSTTRSSTMWASTGSIAS